MKEVEWTESSSSVELTHLSAQFRYITSSFADDGASNLFPHTQIIVKLALITFLFTFYVYSWHINQSSISFDIYRLINRLLWPFQQSIPSFLKCLFQF